MQNFSLTQKEIAELRSEHRQIAHKSFAYRINAILLLGTGWTQSQVSEALLLDQDTLRKLVQKYQTDGIMALISNNYKGSQPKISLKQQTSLSIYLEVNLFLTVKSIIEYVNKEYGIKYSINGMNNLLHRLGFVYKKPKVIPGKVNPDAQKEFLEEYWKLKSSKGKNDPIYFIDGTHPTHNSMPAYGWIKKGQKKELRTNSGRQRININGAVNIETLEVRARYDESINAQSTQKLLQRLEFDNPKAKKIYVICDNARYNRSIVIQAYAKSSKIQMVYLPPYSPNLNLIERLWKFYHKKVLYNKYYETYLEFKQKTVKFFQYIRKYKSELKTLLTENFETIGVATP